MMNSDESKIGGSQIIIYQNKDNNVSLDVRLEDEKEADANVSFFSKELNQYGVIFCISHGYYDSKNYVTWLVTGDGSICTGGDTFDQRLFLSNLYTWWTDYKVSVGYVPEIRGGQEVEVRYFAISDRLLDSEYGKNSFQNSLI